MPFVELHVFVIYRLRKSLPHRACLRLVVYIAARDYRQVLFGTGQSNI